MQEKYADPIDLAAARSQEATDYAIQNHRKPEGPKANGECLCCGEELEGRRWCNASCRDSWENGERPD